jgi:DNA-binding NtrC family response regulator
VVLGSSPEILPEDLGEALVECGGARHTAGLASFHDAVVETKKKVVLDAFRAARGSYTEAARALGLHPNYLHRLVKNLGIEPTAGVN